MCRFAVDPTFYLHRPIPHPEQAAATLEECERLGKMYRPGQAVQATVLQVDRRRHALDLSLLPPEGAARGSTPKAAAGTEVGPAAAPQNLAPGTEERQDPAAAAAAAAAGRAPKAGDLLLGRVTALGGGGIRVQLSAHSVGRVPLTEVHDAAVQDALAGLSAGQYCRCAVLGADPAAAKQPDGGDGNPGSKRQGSGRPLLLSLRPAAGGQCAAHSAAAAAPADTPQPAVTALGPGQLQPGQRFAGYVKSSGPAGVFVCLARNLDARIR
jgi:rRNA biogenesis protein RRP5